MSSPTQSGNTGNRHGKNQYTQVTFNNDWCELAYMASYDKSLVASGEGRGGRGGESDKRKNITPQTHKDTDIQPMRDKIRCIYCKFFMCILLKFNLQPCNTNRGLFRK